MIMANAGRDSVHMASVERGVTQAYKRAVFTCTLNRKMSRNESVKVKVTSRQGQKSHAIFANVRALFIHPGLQWSAG